MTDETNHDDLDRLLNGVDPLRPNSSPSEQESRAALNELRATRLSDVNPGARSRFPRPRVLAGGTVALGASATVATLALGAFSSSPAFAVTSNDNGTVTVKLFRAGEVSAVNARLHALGVRAKFIQVNAVASGCPSPGVVPRQVVMPRAIVITPGKIPSDRTVVLGADGSGHVGYLPKAVLKRIAVNAPDGVLPKTLHPAVRMVHGEVVGPHGKVLVLAGGPPIQRIPGMHGGIVEHPAPTNTSTTGTDTGTPTTQSQTGTATTSSTTGTSTTGGNQQQADPPVPPPMLRTIVAVRCALHAAAGGTSTTGTTTNTSTTDTSTTDTSTDAANTSTTPSK